MELLYICAVCTVSAVLLDHVLQEHCLMVQRPIPRKAPYFTLRSALYSYSTALCQMHECLPSIHVHIEGHNIFDCFEILKNGAKF